jgi:hypothetical protein
MPHHCYKGSIFNLALDILQGRSFVSLVGENQVFNRNGKAHLLILKSEARNPKFEIISNDQNSKYKTEK